MHLLDKEKSLDDQIDQEENKRLRGAKVSQIASDLKSFDGTEKEKLLAYSQHLSWCLKTFERIYKIQQMAAQHASKSLYAHGQANGLISAMAVIMEEQADVPYIKAPEKYKTSEQQFIHETIGEYVYDLENMIGKIMLMEASGPEGYQEEDNPVLAWILDVLHMQKKSPVQTTKLKELRKDQSYEIRKRTENKPNN